MMLPILAIEACWREGGKVETHRPTHCDGVLSKCYGCRASLAFAPEKGRVSGLVGDCGWEDVRFVIGNGICC